MVGWGRTSRSDRQEVVDSGPVARDLLRRCEDGEPSEDNRAVKVVGSGLASPSTVGKGGGFGTREMTANA